MKTTVAILLKDLVANSFVSSFCPFLQTKSDFQQVGGLVTINIYVFCLQRVAVYFKYMPNSIGLYKGIFIHVILDGIIVPCMILEAKLC